MVAKGLLNTGDFLKGDVAKGLAMGLALPPVKAIVGEVVDGHSHRLQRFRGGVDMTMGISS